MEAVHYWEADEETSPVISSESRKIEALCIGSGRFLRAVLIPSLIGGGFPNVALVQPRGRTFLEYMSSSTGVDGGTYEVDTVLWDGSIRTERYKCAAAYSLGTDADATAFFERGLEKFAKGLRILGVGVTEAGLISSETPAMKNLYKILGCIQRHRASSSSSLPKLCVINTDNVPSNGTVLFSHMKTLAKDDPIMLLFLDSSLVFHDSMVDRITSQREGSGGMVPRAEPVPLKALVLLDEHRDLPVSFTTASQQSKYGVVVRHKRDEFDVDIALKLRVANGTHTAIAHLMALLKLTTTDILSQPTSLSTLLMSYLDSLFENQIYPASGSTPECRAVYQDWRKRLVHPHFGLSTFFITQNGAAKGGIRLSPTAIDLIQQARPLTSSLVLAFTLLLRWLTPHAKHEQGDNGIYRGSLEEGQGGENIGNGDPVEYADGLRYCMGESWYEFKSFCQITMKGKTYQLSDLLLRYQQSDEFELNSIVAGYLVSDEGGKMAPVSETGGFSKLVGAICDMYERIAIGSSIVSVLEEIGSRQGMFAQGFDTAV